MAIRRGQLALPEAGTEVFAPVAWTGNNTAGRNIATGFTVDMTLEQLRTASSMQANLLWDRLRGYSSTAAGNSEYLRTQQTAAESPLANYNYVPTMDGFSFGSTASGTTQFNNSGVTAVAWNWKRAPGFCDVVCYTGTGVAGRTVSHNLGVAPEMIWVKSRSAASSWVVYHAALGNTRRMVLNTNAAASGSYADYWNNTSPTAANYTVGVSSDSNGSARTYIAWLFASLDGISKVGSYVGLGAGNPLTIDCGFTSGARFVLIKKTDAATGSAPDGSWFIFDSVRGITTSTDPYLQLNTTSAEASNFSISPHSSGFTVIQDGPTELNQTGKNYIFYAIA